jgi:Secretion system C-terminal sorting domain
MKHIILTSSVILLFTAARSQQQTICFQPDAATAVDASLGYHDNFNTSANNYGTDIYLKAFCIPGAAGGQNTNRALLNFDLSTYPSNAVLLSADLYLYSSGYINNLLPGHFGANSSYIRRVTGNWSENNVTWNSQPATTNVNQVLIPATTSSTQDFQIDVTALVEDILLNPSTSFGFLLGLQTENPSNAAALAFLSSDNSTDPTRWPKLCLTYKGETGIEDTVITLQPQTPVVYPNPTATSITVISPLFDDNSEYTITIYNLSGAVVDQKSNSKSNGQKFELDVSALPAGTYFAEFFDNRKKIQLQFVKTD